MRVNPVRTASIAGLQDDGRTPFDSRYARAMLGRPPDKLAGDAGRPKASNIEMNERLELGGGQAALNDRLWVSPAEPT